MVGKHFQINSVEISEKPISQTSSPLAVIWFLVPAYRAPSIKLTKQIFHLIKVFSWKKVPRTLRMGKGEGGEGGDRVFAINFYVLRL